MWGFGTIYNQSDQMLLVNYAIDAATPERGPVKVDAGALNQTRGNAILEIGSLGALYFTDMGHQEGGPHYWAVDVTYGDSTARWFYDGGGVLDVMVNPDGSFVLAGQGQQISGSLVTAGALGAAEAPAPDVAN